MDLDKQDWKMEQQVWQRVRACSEEPQQNDLRQLQREAMELAAAYRGMVPQLSGSARELAVQLHQGEKANAAVLAGLGYLSRQGGEAVKLWQPGKEALQKTLERCYHRTRRCMTEYLARSAEGEFGVVYQKLAEREGNHCVLIAQLLGGMK